MTTTVTWERSAGRRVWVAGDRAGELLTVTRTGPLKAQR